MGFEALLGNRQLKENLRAGIHRNRVSHFYLISGPEGSGKKTLARLLSAAIVCQRSDKPCLQCPACRKALANSHPDVITVRDEEHKNVAVKLVREIREDMFVRPNEADRKIYIFPQDLGVEGQNALLKILEEPPAYGVFMLLSDNPEKLLPTVRSRATELRLQALSPQELTPALKTQFPDADSQTLQAAIARSGGYLGQAQLMLSEGVQTNPHTETFADCLARRDSLALLRLLVPMERWKRDQLLPVLESWAALLQQALVFSSGAPALSDLARELSAQRSAPELMQALRHLQKAVQYIQSNVSPAAVCGYLEWMLL